MKRSFFLFALMLLGSHGFSQNADSLRTVKAIDSLHTTITTMLQMGHFVEALPIAEDVRETSRQFYGEKSKLYVMSLFLLGVTKNYLGKYDEAESVYVIARDLAVEVFGKDDPFYARLIRGLANVYLNTGKFVEAEALFLSCIAIQEKTLGKEHMEYGKSLYSLAVLYGTTYRFRESEIYFQATKTVYEKTIGKNNLEYAFLLNSQARSLSELGQYDQIELYLLEAKQTIGEILGMESLDYGYVMVGLAQYYRNINQVDLAERCYLKAKDIYSKTLGTENPGYVAIISSLAELYLALGRSKESETIQEEIQIFLTSSAEINPFYLQILLQLACNKMVLNKYAESEAYFVQCNTIMIKSKQPDNFLKGVFLQFWGELYYKMGNYEKAESLLMEAQQILTQTTGKYGEHTIASELILSKVYQKTGQQERAAALLTKLSVDSREQMVNAAAFLSAREIGVYNNWFRFRADQLFSLTDRIKAGQAALMGVSYDQALFYNGFLLEQAIRLQRFAAQLPKETQGLHAEWLNYHRLLAAEYAKPEDQRRNVTAMDSLSEKLEKQLARQINIAAPVAQQVVWQDVQKHLGTGEAAIEFIRFYHHNPEPTDSAFYAALLLRSNDKQPIFIALVSEEDLHNLLISPGDQHAATNQTMDLYASRSVKPIQAKSFSNLYALLWKPLEAHLDGIRAVYFSPVGLMHRLNFNAIPVPGKQEGIQETLSDRYRMVQLGSTRQFVSPTEIKPASNNAYLFGGIQYDVDTSAQFQANSTLDSLRLISRAAVSFAHTDASLRSGVLSYLPFTEEEVSVVEQILKTCSVQTQICKGSAATEEFFKTIGSNSHSSPRILHIATHGFFFPEPVDTLQNVSSGSFGGDEPVFKISDHPMIRSGLLLAGANHAWQTGKPLKPGMEDGILTAYEISQMNLSNTELVVLSACETGLGDIQGNEGVYGLQRAFKIAGAKYLIMSLWQVPDKQTSLLMTTFYKKWLPSDAEAKAGKEQKMTIPEAFRAAQKELRDAGLDPYQWAGFVLVE